MTYYSRKSQRSGKAGNWPQKWFKDKNCKSCGEVFTPTSPCNLYCSVPCETRGYTNAYLKRNYKITIDCYEEMHEKQGGLCAVCGSEGFVMDPTRHKTKLVVDHCHDSGKVRGLLCHNCNRALGLFKDSKESLTKAISYLEGATTISKESTLK